jgi:uncharacterized repeat protein (TIGR01451 family)
LAVTKGGPGLAPAGSTITYVITVTNNGPSDAQAVSLTDMFPSTETFVMQSQSSGPAFTLSSGGNAISDTITTLAAGASATFNVTVTIHSTVANGTTISNTAMVSSSTPDPNPNNNSSTSTLTVGTDTGIGVGPNQTRTINWWDTPFQGQQLIRTAPLTPSAGQTLGQWLGSTYPNLYGGGNGAPDLSGFSNDMVAAFFDSLFHQTTRPRLEANVMATALAVFFTTQSLGGSVGKFYGLSVNAAGVGAYDENVLSSGSAFGVPNNTVLTVDQILQAANNAAVNGHPWNGNSHLQQLAFQVFALINGDQNLG